MPLNDLAHHDAQDASGSWQLTNVIKSFARATSRIGAQPGADRRIRPQIAELHNTGDRRQLADIGVTRSDIESAVRGHLDDGEAHK